MVAVTSPALAQTLSKLERENGRDTAPGHVTYFISPRPQRPRISFSPSSSSATLSQDPAKREQRFLSSHRPLWGSFFPSPFPLTILASDAPCQSLLDVSPTTNLSTHSTTPDALDRSFPRRSPPRVTSGTCIRNENCSLQPRVE